MAEKIDCTEENIRRLFLDEYGLAISVREEEWSVLAGILQEIFPNLSWRSGHKPSGFYPFVSSFTVYTVDGYMSWSDEQWREEIKKYCVFEEYGQELINISPEDFDKMFI